MFNVKLSQVKFYPNQRSYYLKDLGKDEPTEKQNFPYRRDMFKNFRLSPA